MEDIPGELLQICEPRQGVIVGVSNMVTLSQAAAIIDELEQRFPGVTFAVVPGAMSVAFNLPSGD